MASGVGTRLLPDEVNPDAMRRCVAALLDDDRHTSAAAGLQAELGCMPSPAEWIGPLHALAEAAAR